MDKPQRLLAFFGTLLITFGITDLNTDDLSFDQNSFSYIAISLGVFLGILLFWSKHRK